ncbi:MAG: hypothetical protein MSK40_17645 [Parabacteroides sp.]|nr:hypothetical protein [Parabacteroides sp.]
MGIFDKFDKYELFAVYVPTICCISICILASWPLIDWLKCAGLIEYLPPIAKNAFVTIGGLAYIIVLSTFVQRLSKYIVETLWFGKNRDKFPTTKYLLHGDSFGNEIVADKIRSLVKKQYDITLLSARQEKNDWSKAVRSIVSAIDIIKKEVQKANDDMYNRKNRRYGQCRNMIGGMTITFSISILCFISTLHFNLDMICPLTATLISIGTLLYNAIMYKSIANEYANELFNTYISRYEQH